MSPVLRAEESLVSDPVFTNAEDELIPDPAVWADWFDQTDDRRRKLAVGARRYALVSDQLGRQPGWEHFFDPKTGDLLSLDRLQQETAKQQARRVDKNLATIAQQRQQVKQVSQFGFLVPGLQTAAGAARIK